MDIFAAQLGFAPSQTIPPASAIVLTTVFSICSNVPPHKYVIPAPAPAAILSHKMAMRGLTFARGEGLVMDCPEDTIKAVGYVGRAGMKQTDVEILNLMIGKTKLEDIDK